MASTPTRDPEAKQSRWEIRWVLTVVILIVLAGAAWTAMNGRREVPGGATPTDAEWPTTAEGRESAPLPRP